MTKITREINGKQIEIELTDAEVAEIVRNKVGTEAKDLDGISIWVCTIERASQIIARGFLDKRSMIYTYDPDVSADVDIDDYHYHGLSAYIVTTAVSVDYVDEDPDDLVAVCACKCGGNYTMAYTWGCDYTDQERYEYFADEICTAMCNSCGENKNHMIYLKEGTFDE